MQVRVQHKNKLTIDFAAFVEQNLIKQANDKVDEIQPDRQAKEILPRECIIYDQKIHKGEFGILTTANFDYLSFDFYWNGKELIFKGCEGDFRN